MEQTRLLYCRYWVRANQLYHKHNFPHVLIGLEIITSPADNNNRKKGCVCAATSRKSCLSVKFVSFRQSCASAHFGPCLWRKMILSSFCLLGSEGKQVYWLNDQSITVSLNVMSFNSPGRLFEDAEDRLEADI